MANLPAVLMLVHRPASHQALPVLADLDRLPYCHVLEISELAPESIATLMATGCAARCRPPPSR